MTDFESVLKTAKTLAEWNDTKDSIRYFRGNSPVVLPDTLLIEKVEVEKLKTTLQELLNQFLSCERCDVFIQTKDKVNRALICETMKVKEKGLKREKKVEMETKKEGVKG